MQQEKYELTEDDVARLQTIYLIQIQGEIGKDIEALEMQWANDAIRTYKKKEIKKRWWHYWPETLVAIMMANGVIYILQWIERIFK